MLERVVSPIAVPRVVLVKLVPPLLLVHDPAPCLYTYLAEFFERWAASYTACSDSEGNYQSLSLRKTMADVSPTDVCKFASIVLFWPTRTPQSVDFVHETLPE